VKEAVVAGELQIEDVVLGTGAEAVKGKLVSVHYTGWLTDGKKFDSSKDRGQPFQFPLGRGHVIQGWDQGVEGMKVGGKRKLTIPSEMGYGAQGAGGVIPPDATLVFEVELLGVR
jgi:FKBP-type peptidyl-prolyl cis-trans isomerase